MFGLRLPELLIILVVLVLLFGSKKLPELGDALGKGVRAFKKASDKALSEGDASGGGEAKQQAASAAKVPSARDGEK